MSIAYRMRFGEKCKEKTTLLTEDSPRVTDLINNANFLLNVSASQTSQAYCSRSFAMSRYYVSI